MRVLGFMTIHYGLEYLKEALISVAPFVDKMVVAYSKHPSHGHHPKGSCPEGEQEIFDVCVSVLGDKFIWERFEGFPNEASHRDVRYKHAQSFDLILTVDADEVFEPKDIPDALSYAFNGAERYYGIKGYINFWRSFNYCCLDGFRPIRIEKLHANNQLQNLECPLTIYHFSTCQSESIMRYKYKIFGHASEIRANFLEVIFYAWTPENDIQDIHPVAYGLWNTIKFDRNTLPEHLKAHANFDKYLV